MSRKQIGFFFFTIFVGLVTNLIWEWVKPYVPLPQNATITAEPPKPVPQSTASHQPSRSEKWKDVAGEIAWELARVVPQTPLFLLSAITGLYIVVYVVQLAVQMWDKFGAFFEWLGDTIPTVLWPFVFLIGAPIACFYAAFMAGIFGIRLWVLLLIWPFRFVIAKFKGKYPTPEIPDFWSVDPYFDL